METGYTIKENKHTSLLEEGFMPVEEKQMNKNEVIEQLKGLKDHCKDFKGEEPWDSDIKALDYAIQELEGTAQEVPVQEQSRFVPTDSSGTIYPEGEPNIQCPSN